MSVLDLASGVQDLFFTTHRSGTFYTYTDYLVLEGGGNEVRIPFPCQITVNGRCKIVITEVDGLIDTVKEDMGFSGYNLNISFEAGDYRRPLISGGGAVKAHKVISALALLVRSHKGTVSITEGVGLHFDKGGSFLEKVQDVAESASQVFRGQESLLDPRTSLLSDLGISKVVLQTIAVNPVKNHRYQVTLTAVAEMDEDADLFPDESNTTPGG
ncbi:MAG: hypothetical protein E3J71_02335 [Candidatus Stahlbacteria bacterium]|nr:MAG: hypothetical protein E3J71_02335 [Candidatus Stahlbacteria bacterium]